jgi:dTDP-4-amino-4,6-dideoxygalactose transaminase
MIPFNKPVVLPGHGEWLARALAGGHIAGLGQFSLACEKKLEAMVGRRVLLCTSATHALEMAALLLDLHAGDEVILPSYTFVSTANAFALRGATLRFADNDANGNITLAEIQRLATNKTRAVVVVHYGGNSAAMLPIVEWCNAHAVKLIEDAAQAIGATSEGRPLGTFGDMACFSFHETKNITSGEGGVLVLEDTALIERAEIIREKGTNRRRFQQGLVDKYTWVGLGSSYVLSDLNAAYLLPQLSALADIQARRKALWLHYEEALRDGLSGVGARVIYPPANNTPNYHMFAVVMANAEQREKFIAFLKARHILAPFHYVSLHQSPYGRRYSDGEPEALPECEILSAQLVRLPLFFNMTDEEQAEVETAIRDFCAA